jgi:DNA-binding MarR family transcriptional regulator
MKPSNIVYLQGESVIAIVDGKAPIPLKNLPARIVTTLSRKSIGATGSQLAQELGVTPAAITKAAAELVDFGIVRKEPLPVARNVKLYFLAVTVVDDEVAKQLRKELPPILLKLIGEKFKGNEALATVFVGQLLDYVKGLPESDKVLQQILDELLRSDHAKLAKN